MPPKWKNKLYEELLSSKNQKPKVKEDAEALNREGSTPTLLPNHLIIPLRTDLLNREPFLNPQD